MNQSTAVDQKPSDPGVSQEMATYYGHQNGSGTKNPFLPDGWGYLPVGGKVFQLSAPSGRRYDISNSKSFAKPAIRPATWVREKSINPSAKRPKKGPTFYYVQEGGSSAEIYLHGYDTLKAAEKGRVSCAKGAYRTSEIVEVPRELADTPGFHDAVQAILEASLNCDY